MHDFITVCEKAVRAAGATLQQWVGQFTAREKGPADLVTQADLAAQQAVEEIVLQAFPDHGLLGEEAAETTGKSDYRWIVDPLDGTANYVHGVPFYSVSLALERAGELLVGAVYNPVSNDLFSATAGGGALLNGKPIHTSNVTELSGVMAAAGFPPGVTHQSPDYRVFHEAVACVQSIRRTGSAALNLCFLAAGWNDLYWSFGTKIWDVAAGVLIVREAGGIVTAPDGGDFILEQAQFVASAGPELQRQSLDLVRRALAS